MKMSIGNLRREFPAWTWRTARDGMCWEYVGTQGGSTVRIHPVAEIVGPNSDDFATRWHVDTGDGTMSYGAWWLKEHVL